VALHGCTQPKKIKEELQKRKSRYSDLFLVTAAQTPPRQHQKFSISNSNASKKETMHKLRRRPIIDHRISPRRKSSLTKQ
jgi:hypothetical protein